MRFEAALATAIVAPFLRKFGLPASAVFSGWSLGGANTWTAQAMRRDLDPGAAGDSPRRSLCSAKAREPAEWPLYSIV